MKTFEEQRVLIYAQIWAGAEPGPDDTRVRYSTKPAGKTPFFRTLQEAQV